MGKRVTVHHNGKDYHGEIGTVDNVRLAGSDADHGVMKVSVAMNFGGSGQSAGLVLDRYDAYRKRRVGTAAGLDFILQLLWVAGVECWEDLKGTTLVALRDGSSWNSLITGFAHPVMDRVIIFKDLFSSWEGLVPEHKTPDQEN